MSKRTTDIVAYLTWIGLIVAFLAGDRREANAFRGEYMSNYSWAETTLGALTRKEGQGETGS